MKRTFINILIFLVFIPIISFSQKTDLIRLKNGDYVTGEIKSLMYGILEYKTDGMSTLNVKWDHVTQIKSKYKFEVTLDQGGVYLAYIDTTSALNEVRLIINSKVYFDVEIAQIVEILQIKDSFWDRFSGEFGFGLNYTKGSNILSYDFSGDLLYRIYKSETRLKIYSNYIDDKNNGNKSIKQNADIRFNQQLKYYWFYSGFTGAEQNSELGLDLRTTIGGGFGRNLLYTHKSTIQISGNLVVNREWPTEGEQKNNIEGLAYLEYRIFNNAPPKTKLLSYMGIYPSFSSWGRIRANYEIEGSIEIWPDFVYKLTYYYNYDSQPATEGAQKKDWGITTSIGYKFN